MNAICDIVKERKNRKHREETSINDGIFTPFKAGGLSYMPHNFHSNNCQ